MSDAIDFALFMLDAISDFLSAEPMIYLVGFILLAIIFKVFMGFIGIGYKSSY